MPRKPALTTVATVPAEPVPAGSPQFHPTVRLMLEVAERLFAEQGVESVTLNRIVEESGQRNRSALHYHFGSRAHLVTALLTMRLAQVNVLRHRSLDALEARGEAGDLHAVVLASIEPLAHVVRYEAWGQHFLRVLAQTLLSPNLRTPDVINPEALSGIVRTHEIVRKLLPDVPRSVLDARFLMIRDHVPFGLYPVVRESGTAGVTPAVLLNLANYCAATLSADHAAAKAPRKSVR